MAFWHLDMAPSRLLVSLRSEEISAKSMRPRRFNLLRLDSLEYLFFLVLLLGMSYSASESRIS